MRVLIVDSDSEMLDMLARKLRDGFSTDIVTSKAAALDLLRVDDLHVLVACEQLSDGSGLDLLSQAARKWPQVLRVFSVSTERLVPLRGKLGPFKLFQVLNYPIDAGELGSILMLAQAAQAADADTANVQHIVLSDGESERAGSPAAMLAQAALSAAPNLAVARGAARPMPFTVTRPPVPPARAAPASAPAARKPLTRESLAATPRPLPAIPQPSLGRPAAPPVRSRPRPPQLPKAANILPALAQLRSRLHGARAAGAKPPRNLTAAAVAAGVLVLAGIGGWVLFGGSEPKTASGAVIDQSAPAEAVIGEIEAAITSNDMREARRAVRKLRRVAPKHPRLEFFSTLLEQRAALDRQVAVANARAEAAEVVLPSARKRNDLPLPRAPTTESASAAAIQAPTAPAMQPPVQQSAFDTASDPVAMPPPPMSAPAQTFSGRTLESGPTLVIREAELIKRVAPEFPAEAAARGQHGVVEVAFTVTSAGTVANTSIVESTPPGVFDRAALQALREWRYEPRTENGVPVNWNTRARIEFKLAR